MVNKILVVDFGSQYNQLIVRRIRELGVYSELVPHTISLDQIKNDPAIKGIIFSGGPNSVYAHNAPKIDSQIYQLAIPILGICYGMQLMAKQLGGKVSNAKHHEYGRTNVNICESNPLNSKLAKIQQVWMSHGDKVTQIPKGFKLLATSAKCHYAMIGDVNRNLYGIQFHPEVNHTINGKHFLANFVFNVCRATNNWTMNSFVNQQINFIKQKVGNEKVLCALSGGVDSSVTAALIAKAINKNLTCLFVDHGMLRLGEADRVTKTFKDHFHVNFIRVNAANIFLKKLSNVIDPESKRKIIGKTFIQIFERYAKKIKNLKWLAQGTLYTDVIESGTTTAQTIKSHHNVGGLPKNMKLKLLEPLNKLFKDEVRALGKTLKLPDNIVYQQPFPGPGIAIRIIGSINKQKIHLVQATDAILRQEFAKAHLDKSIWQYFTVLPGIKTVGVKGDQRSYEQLIAIRAVTSQDGMTADYAKIPYAILDLVANRIVNEIPGINRVVYDISSKPPGTIEWE